MPWIAKNLIENKYKMLIQKYQSSWVVDFNTIKSVIKESLTDLDFSIENI
jgi:hypothetical protein